MSHTHFSVCILAMQFGDFLIFLIFVIYQVPDLQAKVLQFNQIYIEPTIGLYSCFLVYFI